MLQALMAADARLDLVAAVDAAAAVQPIAVGAESRAAVLEFVERRLEQMLLDAGVQIEAVRAALRERGRDAALAARTAREIAVSGWARH
jgi:glycyl-tRNA synthetase